MTTFDIILVLVLVGSAAWGFWKGVITQVGGFGGIVAAVMLCRIAGPWLANVIACGGLHPAEGAEMPDPNLYQVVLARVILFMVAFFAVKIVAHFCRAMIHAVSLGFLDRIAGAAFCMFEWMMLLSLGLNFWMVVNPHVNIEELSGMGYNHLVRLVVNLAPELLGWALE